MSRFDPSLHVTPRPLTFQPPIPKNCGTRLGIALRYNRLFYSACVGRFWQRSLRCAPCFFTLLRASTYGFLRRLYCLPHCRNTIFFTVLCKITANVIKDTTALLSRWKRKITRYIYIKVRNPMHLTLEFAL